MDEHTAHRVDKGQFYLSASGGWTLPQGKAAAGSPALFKAPQPLSCVLAEAADIPWSTDSQCNTVIIQ